MRLTSIEGIKPSTHMVLVDIIPTNEVSEDKLLIEEKESTPDEAKMYFGKVVSMGPEASENGNCPGLKEGETAMFSQFAGHHIAVEGKFVKVLRGYDIMATLENINDITASNVHPAADRILVSCKYRDESDNGLVLNEVEARDPMLADLDYGVVLSKGPSCDERIEVGQTVAFTPYVGECVKKQPEENIAEYRVLSQLDVLFTI